MLNFKSLCRTILSVPRLAHLIVLAGAFTVIAVPAQAATITVNGLGDTLSNNGVCTIREAMINANNDAATWADCAAGSGVDTINLPAGTITITIPNTPSSFSQDQVNLRGDFDISSSMIINGNVAGTTINGGALDRIFDVNPDTDFDPMTPTPTIVVTINRLTMTNGFQNQGGALAVFPNATLAVNDSTISASRAWADDGGGMYVFGGAATMTNCTVSGNTAFLHAGGIRSDGVLALISCTVTDNDSDFNNLAGGLFNSSGPAANFTLRNTIVAGNQGVDCPNALGAFTSLGYNIIGEFGTIMSNPTITPTTGDQFDVSDASVMLGSLANNGGPTPTHALGAGSIAIDQGHASGTTADQRSETRPCDLASVTNATGGDGTDVGAFEVQGVCGGNSAPTAVDDSATVNEDSGGNLIDVLANDSDPDMDTLTITAVTQGTNGSVINNGTSVTYTPNANFFGPDSFTYTIDDGNGNTDTATVNVTVTNEQDAPNANDDMATVAEDSGANTINVLTNDSDVDGDTLTVSTVTQGANGSVSNNGTSVSYTPNANFFGSDSFTYTVSDGNGGTDTATVQVTVTNVNDAPVANGDSYSTNSNTPLIVPPPGVLVNDMDIDGDTLTAQLVSGPSHAATFALNSDGSFNYTPTFNYAGPDSFTYKAFDGTAYSNTVTVNITVIDTVPPDLIASVADSSLWPPNHNLVNVGLSVTASDNSGDPVTTQVFVFSDEDDLEPGSGNHSPDAKNIAPATLRLRADRSGNGDGRVYLIVVVATDSSGNISRACLTVVVPHSQSQSAQNSVNAQAAAAKSYCEANNGAPPPGYYVVGDGPVVGPKQ